ncbi:MAG: phosphoglucosamine mutase [Solirubrobacteraceae bacterium]
MRKLFGTDGVRGPVGEIVTPQLALALGTAATRRAVAGGVERPQMLVVRDTRESGGMLEAALAAGVAAAGGDTLLGGVVPTAAAPLLIRHHGFDLAAVISASHNPYRDNGIKFFGGDGLKLSDEAEAEIESELGAADPPVGRPGQVRDLHGCRDDYLRALQGRFGALDLSRLDVVLDCANGAAYRAAPEIFQRLGATVTALAAQPDGRNINAGCGSTHVETLLAAMAAGGHDVGFAFDGDADRVLAVDRTRAVVDGDELLALAARHLQAAQRLPGAGVVVTVMTNYGFHAAMAEAGIEVATTPVGDRYVLEELIARGWALGGEQSGHIIELGFVPSGDGIAAALLALEALGGGDLSQRVPMTKLPQRLVNVRVGRREGVLEAPAVEEAVERESAALRGRGRVLVRASGTEPVVRVMAEAPTGEEAEAACRRLAAAVEAAGG